MYYLPLISNRIFVIDTNKHSVNEVYTTSMKCHEDIQCQSTNEMSLKCLELEDDKRICIHDPAILCKCDDDCPLLNKCVDLFLHYRFGVCVPPSNKNNYNTTQNLSKITVFRKQTMIQDIKLYLPVITIFVSIVLSIVFFLAMSTQTMVVEKTTETSSSSSNQAFMCKDEPHCNDFRPDEITCQNDADIFRACFASCTGCKCKDTTVCSTLRLSPKYCQHSAFVRENCPKSCQLCQKIHDKGIGIYHTTLIQSLCFTNILDERRNNICKDCKDIFILLNSRNLCNEMLYQSRITPGMLKGRRRNNHDFPLQ